MVAPTIATSIDLIDKLVRGRRLVRGKLRLTWLAQSLWDLRVLLPHLPNTRNPRDARTEEETVAHIFLFHVMGQDDANGSFRLRNGKLDLRWQSPVAKQPTFTKARELCEAFATAMDGRYVPMDEALPQLRALSITHPLGGCGIARSRDEGVVDEFGRVYDRGRANSTAVHEGLYVVDGSAMPGRPRCQPHPDDLGSGPQSRPGSRLVAQAITAPAMSSSAIVMLPTPRADPQTADTGWRSRRPETRGSPDRGDS